MPRMTLLILKMNVASHVVTRNYWTTIKNCISLVNTFIWYLKGTEACNCNLKSRNGFHASKLVRNDISHFIIGSLVKKIFLENTLAAILDFFSVFAKLDIEYMRNFSRVI